MMKLLALAALLAAAAAAPGDYPQIDLKQTGSTLTSVTVSWTLDVSEFVPITYTLLVNGVLTIEFFDDGTCTYTFANLQSCTHYTIGLTANYAGGSGETAYLIASTDYETPGAVGDLSVDGSIISWTAPTNARCVDYYIVCYLSIVTDNSECQEGVISTSYDMGEVSACDELDVTVSAVGGDLTGEASTVHVSTPDGVPGPLMDVEVVLLDETSVLVWWNPPLENPACCQDYAIIYGPVTNFTATKVFDPNEESKTEVNEDREEGMAEGPSGQTEFAVLDNLWPCTDYRFVVSCSPADGNYGSENVVCLSTNETAPGILPDVVFDQDEESITVSWGDVSEVACLNVIQICYIDPIENTFHCVEVPSSPNTWTVSGLSACREYEFRIAGVSPGGLIGEPTVATVPTKDKAPGAVQNLELGNVKMTSLTVTYNAPIDNPECVDKYVVTYKNVLDVLDTRSASTRAGTFNTNIDGLDACATYDIGVTAVSPNGIVGPVTHIGTTLEQGAPDPPSSGTLVTSTDTSLTVLWFGPTDTRFCVDTYEVRVSADGYGSTELVPVLDFKHEVLETFTGLDPCSSYMVQIRSTNSATSSQSFWATVINDAMTLCP